MSEERKDQRPAFPVPSDHIDKGFHADWRGMTLRDWFAGQALAGMIASGSRINSKTEVTPNDYVSIAYQFADSMLRAREAK